VKLPQTRAERIRWGVIAAVVIVALVVGERLLGSIDLEKALDDISSALGDWTYVLVGVMAFLETGAFVGLVAPGETFVMLAGAVAGQGETSILLTIAVVWLCAWAGDSASFVIGGALGRDFIMRHGPKVRITPERFNQVERYFQRHGGKTILIGRFIGLVRALAPFIAGSSGMRYRGFVPYSVLGTGLWATAFSLIGYFAARSLNQAKDWVGRGLFLFALTVGLIVGVVLAVRYLREPANRERAVQWMEQRRVLAPLVAAGRWIKPEARFVWNRVTPGGLGLELTTLLAVLAVGSFVVTAYAMTFHGDPGPTTADSTTLDVADNLRAGWLTDIAKGVTVLGSSAVTVPIAGIAVILLGLRRRWGDAAVLVAALVIAHMAVPLLKDAIDRPRPPDPLVDASGSAYPSGHATYAVLYVWLALIVTVRARPGRAGGGALIVAGIVLAAAIGLSRVYLRVHYLSDVTGGWGLGASAFALCAAVALVAMHLRRAAREEPAAVAPE
jgi:membrane protein DedA with SNARE-associated domain/membrane-associated phospholipid phosphatase